MQSFLLFVDCKFYSEFKSINNNVEFFLKRFSEGGCVSGQVGHMMFSFT